MRFPLSQSWPSNVGEEHKITCDSLSRAALHTSAVPSPVSIRMNFPSCILRVNIFTCDSETSCKQKSVVKYSGKNIVDSRTTVEISTAIIMHLKIQLTRKMQVLSKKMY